MKEGEPGAARAGQSLGQEFNALVRAILRTDDREIEEAATSLGSHYTLLAPVAWGASGIGFAINGIIFLLRNWVLLLIQLPPAAWVWLATWEIKSHIIEGTQSHRHTGLTEVAIVVAVYAGTILAFWCNVTFAYAIEQPGSVQLRQALRRSRHSFHIIVVAGLVVGTPIVIASLFMSHAGPFIFILVLTIATVFMVLSFVMVPARLIGARPAQMGIKTRMGAWFLSGILSLMAMSPGFVLARVGLLLLGFKSWRILGFVLLSVGSGLYAAGMSSLKALKLTARLGPASVSSSKKGIAQPSK